MNKKSKTIYSLLIILGVLILINILASRFFFRMDLTADKRYTLSDATKNILKEIPEPITITAYFSEDLPPEVGKVRKEFKDMLIEYVNRSGGNIAYEFKNPGKDDATEREAMQKGIQPILIQQREKDQAVQKKAYLGAVVSYKDQTEVIPVIQSGSAMEYDLSTSIKKLIATDKPVIGFLQGHGEASISSMIQAVKELDVLYQIEPVNMTDSTDLSIYKTLVMVRPEDSIQQSQFDMLDNYLAKGGNLLIAFDRVEGDFQSVMGKAKTTGLETWLAKKGIQVPADMITDATCGNISVQQNNGFMTFSSQVKFPYFPIVNKFADNPITSGLEAVIFQFVSPLNYNGDSTVTFTPIVMTGNKSNAVPTPVYFNIEKKWSEKDFPEANIPIGGIFSGKLSGNTASKMIVFTDGEFPINGDGQRQRQINADNVNLLVNSVDWLSDDTGLIDLRTKGITARLLDQVDDSTKSLLKWLNFLLPILLIVIYGIFRSQRNRIRRIKRMEEDYV
ncbi:GldG family protein [Saccharicrinis sp. FJH62]|uniref:GldG family protein n=1 Tax=Saccharicrinis sp. FJH62 TaxID=3344657 RepID=UPI0035D3DEAE